MEKLCPLPDEHGKRGPCLEHRCRWYIQLLGKHPQKDAPVEEWDCAISFIPLLLIENAQQTRQFAAAVESARNQANADTQQMTGAMKELATEVIAQSGMRVEREVRPPRVGFVGRLLGRKG